MTSPRYALLCFATHVEARSSPQKERGLYSNPARRACECSGAVRNEAIVKRIALRRSCGQCGAVYHLENNPPANDAVCDRCGAEVIARPDDTEEAVRKRLFARSLKSPVDVPAHRNSAMDGWAMQGKIATSVRTSGMAAWRGSFTDSLRCRGG